jgi:EPS-associated MarR family transcriptional regulator
VLSLEQFVAPKPPAHPLHVAMASKHLDQVEDLHFRVLQLLQDNPELSQRELANRLGVSNGKLHYCIRALMDKGLVKLGNFANSKHHLGYAYLLTPAGIAQKANLTGRFLKRKIAEYEALRAEIKALQAEMKTHGGSANLG